MPQDEVLLRDECGGVALTALPGRGVDVHGQYHYRGEPPCAGVAIASGGGDDTAVAGHSRLLGFMLDGVPLFGAMGGLDDLDECGGHTDKAFPMYHYHAQTIHPYTVSCLRGCLVGSGPR